MTLVPLALPRHPKGASQRGRPACSRLALRQPRGHGSQRQPFRHKGLTPSGKDSPPAKLDPCKPPSSTVRLQWTKSPPCSRVMDVTKGPSAALSSLSRIVWYWGACERLAQWLLGSAGPDKLCVGADRAGWSEPGSRGWERGAGQREAKGAFGRSSGLLGPLHRPSSLTAEDLHPTPRLLPSRSHPAGNCGSIWNRTATKRKTPPFPPASHVTTASHAAHHKTVIP